MADEWIEKCNGEIGIAGRTFDDTVKALVQGPSGILATQKPWNKCRFENKLVKWESGAVGHILTGDKPQGFRAWNLGFLWCDEFAHWKYPQECKDAFEYSVRAGTDPSILITSTPIPHPAFIKIANDPKTLRIMGHTLENAINIPPSTLAQWLDEYDGTPIGAQELGGEILETCEHAIWKQEWIKRIESYEAPGLLRTVVAIDPAGSHDDNSDETGIVVVAIDDNANTYLLEDLSGKYESSDWAGVAIHAARAHGADAIVGERNFGGDMVLAVIRQHPDWADAQYMGIDLKDVHAVGSKSDRARPAAAMYRQGRGYHVGDPRKFLAIEHQMVSFNPKLPRRRQKSPDRMDALVHAMAELHPPDAAPVSHSYTDADVAEWDRFLRGRP